ncbi:ImmA/IrrE family metallo-endopeptidase [Macrococcus capreoli]
MNNTVKINPKVLRQYILNSNIPLENLRDEIKSIDLILSGEKSPSFNQLSRIAKKLNIPTGLLVLPEIVDTPINNLDFRTVDSTSIEEMSSELKDTIIELKTKQEFLEGEIENKLNFVGMFNTKTDIKIIVSKARELLEIDEKYYKDKSKKDINFFRKQINQLGIYIFFNGKVKDNTHRLLQVNEFRGIALSNNKAPIIFINQKDSKNGQLFTLIHEFTHILLGHNEIFNDRYVVSNSEMIANKVAAEILVPETELLIQKDKSIENLYNIFPVSKHVIARRLFDLNILQKHQYEDIVDEIEYELNQIKNRNKSTGGNYNNNLKFRIDKQFLNYVNNAVNENRITMTEGMNLIGVGYKGYKILTQ